MPVCSERIFVLRPRYSGSLPEPQFSKQVCHFFGRSEKSWSSKLFCFFFLPSLLPSMEHFPSLLHLSLSLCLLPRGMRGVLRPSAIWPPRRLWRLSVCLSLSLLFFSAAAKSSRSLPESVLSHAIFSIGFAYSISSNPLSGCLQRRNPTRPSRQISDSGLWD